MLGFFTDTKTGRLLVYVFFAVIIGAILMWLWAGGFARVRDYVASMGNPIGILLGTSEGRYRIALPGEVPIPQGPDISSLVGSYEESPESTLSDLESEYERLRAEAKDVEAFGEISPYRGRVRLSLGSARAPGVREYIVLEGTGARISLANWSLMSLISRTRVPLPLAASPYKLGAINAVGPVSLASGEYAIVTTGVSPLGVSFRENSCTGYLEELQDFEPSLRNTCPDPSEVLALSASTVERYGENCIDYLANLPQCDIAQSVPSSLSPACRLFIANTFTYNGCVDTYRRSSGFEREGWRLYLGLGAEIWKNSHDVIRLLDAEGRTVDALTY